VKTQGRPHYARHLVPPAPTGDSDELDRTARQVRVDRKHSTVHEVVRAWTDRQVGRTYKTRCAHVMTGQEGAVLTTRKANCGPCLRGGR
jgi:hypothetical protein